MPATDSGDNKQQREYENDCSEDVTSYQNIGALGSLDRRIERWKVADTESIEKTWRRLYIVQI